MKLVLFVLIGFLVAPLVVSAHGDGPFVEIPSGAYLVDIGYSSAAPSDGEAVLFDFSLVSLASRTAVPFADVWLKIENERKTVVLATGIHNAEFGGPRLSYIFPAEGNYTVSARYEDRDGSIAEASFPLRITPATKDPQTDNRYLFGILGLLIGAAATFFALRKKPV